MTNKKIAANTGKTIKPKGKPRGRPWPKGVSGNPAGRPKDGQSWSAIISELGDMYPEDIIAFIPKNNPLGKEIAKLPKSVQMKYLVIMRVYMALMFEPSSGLLKEFMERMEGKLPQQLDLTGWKQFMENDDPDSGTSGE